MLIFEVVLVCNRFASPVGAKLSGLMRIWVKNSFSLTNNYKVFGRILGRKHNNFTNKYFINSSFMKKIRLFYFFVLFSSLQGFPQLVIKGSVGNFSTKEPLAYVNIGIRDKEVGTISDKNGNFVLSFNQAIKENELVVFSHIGFESFEISLKNLSIQNEIWLVPSVNELNEVVLIPPKTWTKKIGRTAKGAGMMHISFYSTYEKEINVELGREKGMLFDIKNDCRLDNLNFCISGNEFKSIKFRLNIYNLKGGIPNENILEKNIIIEVKDGQTDWFQYDLKPYEIYLAKELNQVAITLTWLESEKMNEKNWRFSFYAAMLPYFTMFNRDKSMASWTKSDAAISMYLNTTCYK